MTIKITKTPSIDTRQGILPPKDLLMQGTIIHINDVVAIYSQLCQIGYSVATNHDTTKIKKFDMFYDNFEKVIKTGSRFETLPWWKLHVTEERHHCLDYKGREKLNLLDILEMCCDVVAAGKARQGVFNLRKFNNNRLQQVLLQSFYNTIDLVDIITVVE